MSPVTVRLDDGNPYAESDHPLYRMKRRLTYRHIMRILTGLAGSHEAPSILEVGTGAGFLLSFLEAELPHAGLVGLEYDPRLVELSRAKLKRAQVIRGNAEDLGFGSSVFDLVVSCQVIEHLYRPECMLQSVRRCLRVGGHMVLTTPNLRGLGARVMGPKWHGYREDHVSLKSARDWTAFVEGHGFRTNYSGSTFFSGIPILNRFPFGVVNWTLLLTLGSLRWHHGESFVGVFERI